jgi:hypothetical protein
MVGATNRSMAAMSGAWLRRKVRHPPERIVGAHPSDQRAQVRVDLRPASKEAGFPTPVPAEAGSVPSHEGSGRRS